MNASPPPPGGGRGGRAPPPPPPPPPPAAAMALWEWRRLVADLYHEVRRLPPRDGWGLWVETRGRLLQTHPQSPVPVDRRSERLRVYDYDPSARISASVQPVPPRSATISHNLEASTPAHPLGSVTFDLAGKSCQLTLYWLDDYAGGVFLPFRDGTNGLTTYGGGRYLLDTAKGADLGWNAGEVVLDFNFAFHPSCAYDDAWSCPLAPVPNHLGIAVEAGERLR